MTLQVLDLHIAPRISCPPPTAFRAVLDVKAEHFASVWNWIGAARLTHEALLQLFTGSRRSDSAEFVLGNAVAYLASSGLAASMPASCLGRSIAHLNAWVAADAYVIPAFDGAAVLSGTDVAVTPEGTLWLHLIGDTGIPVGFDAAIAEVVLTVDEGDRAPETRRLVAEVRFEQPAHGTAA